MASSVIRRSGFTIAFVKAYPAETTETFLDGHVSALGFFGGVPQSVLYDNTRIAVARILGDGTWQRPRSFTALQSHYLFEDRFVVSFRSSLFLGLSVSGG